MIRAYRVEDEAQVIVIARHLQAHESAYFDRLIPPADIGADYVARLEADVAEHHGRFIVAETGGVVAGYCTLLMLDSADERDEVFYTFAHVGDLAVHENYRNRGVGQALLDECEAVARNLGKKWLRLGVLAENTGARALLRAPWNGSALHDHGKEIGVKDTLSIAEARRMALAAQGFINPDRSGTPGWAKMAKAVDQLHLLQIDSVNVLVRSHYLPLYSRLGAYDRAKLDAKTLRSKGRAMFECWAHEASLLPMELHPLVRWRMDRARAGNGTYGSMDRFGKDERAYVKSVLDFVTRHGPTAVSDLPDSGKGAGGWWGWSRGKMALECLFDRGLVTTAKRESFERYYDLPERVIPADVLARQTPSER